MFCLTQVLLQQKTYGNADANKDEQPVRSINVAKSLTQVAVLIIHHNV
jgi:hypothetical protein